MQEVFCCSFFVDPATGYSDKYGCGRKGSGHAGHTAEEGIRYCITCVEVVRRLSLDVGADVATDVGNGTVLVSTVITPYDSYPPRGTPLKCAEAL